MGLRRRAEYNSDSEETTTKSTEQLDLCHRWQQTNHHYPYLNMCPRPNSLLTQSRRGERRRDLVQPHDGSENPPPASPLLTALLPLQARGLFLTPPHSFSAINSFLSSSFWIFFFGKGRNTQTLSFHSPLRVDLQHTWMFLLYTANTVHRKMKM